VTNVETAQPSLISLFVTDLLLVLIMLAGLLRLRRGSGGAFRLWRLLWRQVRAAVLAGCDVVDLLMHFTFERVSSGSLLPPSQNSSKWYV
jgi:hypothetical protein